MSQRLQIRCEHCHDGFEVAPSLRGGITNCPSCGKATPVEGENDPLWTGIRIAGLLAAVGLGGIVGVVESPAVGVLVGLIVGGGGWLLSRLL